MKPKLKMELGAEPRRVVILLALLALAGYLFYTNVLSPSGETAAVPGRATPPAGAAPQPVQPDAAGTANRPGASPRTAAGSGRREFRPSLKARPSEPRVVPDTDPALRTDLLQKLAAVSVDRVERSLFEFGNSSKPAPDAAKPKLPEPKIVVEKRMIGPPPPPPPPPPPVKPPPPPINLKFYGNALPSKGGVKRVFCIQGDEILTPAEGDVIQRRYRIVRINPASVLVEDLEYKHQQTLPIEEPAQTG